MQITDHRNGRWKRWLPIWIVVPAACVFIAVATYRIELPGLYFDEMIFADAAQGNFDTARIHLHVGAVPILVMGYIGALKAWIYTPIFRFLGVSALTARLPVILIAAATLIIWFCALRPTLGNTWAVIVTWLLALDPANIFPSRLDWGPTVLMHFFQASILALWFNYRNSPHLWKMGLIGLCCGLGFFDKFNFIWFVAAFAVGVFLCYPDSVKCLWVSTPKLIRWFTIVVSLVAVGVALRLILPIMQFPSPGNLTAHLMQSWSEFQIALSGAAVAQVVFGSSAGIIALVPHKTVLIVACLAVICCMLSMSDANARENRRNGLFCIVVGMLIFAQIVVTPQAGGPHHHSMLFPLPLLAGAFLARSFYEHFNTIKISWAAVVLGAGTAAAAVCFFFINIHNTMVYVTHFRSNPNYMPLWSPAIYSLSRYINDHGREARKIISVDCCMEQLHSMAPKKVRQRFRDFWPVFKQAPKTLQQEQAFLDIFPEGKTLIITFDASKETFAQTRRNFLDFVSTHPELNCRLVKEFWYGGQKIYDVYEVIRSPR